MILDRFKLTDRVAVVTGAGKGIGRAIAIAFAEAGADIVLGARTEADLEAVGAEIKALGRRALGVSCDVMNAEDREKLLDAAVGEFGRLDVLVNNAGGWPPAPAFDTRDKDFDGAMRFNVTQAFALTRDAAKRMAETAGRGSVVNVTSLAGIEPGPCFAAYGTAKAALNFLTQEMAQDLAPKVRVNAVAPGSIETDALAEFLSDDLKKQMVDATPMARLGRAEDIAACALYLASDASDYVTGQIVGVHGGTIGLNIRLPRADY